MVKTKIVCTLGPASSNERILRKMVRAGMDVVRLNFSHGTHKSHNANIDLVRKLNKKHGFHIKIMQDLEGHRIRVGGLKGHKPIVLKKSQTAWMVHSLRKVGSGNTISFDYEGPLTDIKAGQHIYIDDGTIALRVLRCEKKRLKTEVIVPGTLKEHKGINVPGAQLHFPGITAKDVYDIHFGIAHGVDYIAQSFVQAPDDILEIKKMIRSCPRCPAIIAKIESREGIRNIDDIIDVSDGIMVARGDMGVSIPIYEIPIVQKTIIRKCNQKGKFVITATQMLESMTENVRPTRAEVTDVANAILDGSDYVMLSAESAVGRYPIETVRMMHDIIQFTEQSKLYKQRAPCR